MKRTTKSLIALLVLVAMCVSFCVPTFAAADDAHEHAAGELTYCTGSGNAHELKNFGLDGENWTDDNAYVEKVKVVNPGCGEQGYTLYMCKECEEVFVDSWVPANANTHNWSEVDGTRINPTCVADGSYIEKCDKCGQERTQTVTKLGHDFDANNDGTPDWVYSNPEYICGDDGVTRTKTCVTCNGALAGGVVTENVDTGDHDWVVTITKKPTCVSTGTAKYECAYCTVKGSTAAIPKLDSANPASHSWVYDVNAEGYKAPTCQEFGTAVNAKCSVCKKVEATLQLDKVGHNFETVKEKEATCTEDGTKAYEKCTVCNTLADAYKEWKEEDFVIPAFGHLDENGGTTCRDYNEEKYEPQSCKGAFYYCATEGCTNKNRADAAGDCAKCGKALTYDDGGIGHAYYDCSRCGAKDIHEELPRLPHGNTQHSKQDPTCTQFGFESDACLVCGDYTYFNMLPPYTHDLANSNNKLVKNDAESVEPKCGVAGEYVYYCSECGYKVTETKEALEHDFEEKTVAPTCYAEGYCQMICKICKVADLTVDGADAEGKYNPTAKDPNNHVLKTNWTTQPTCTTAGLSLTFCEKCTWVDPNGFQVVSPLEHDAAAWNEQYPDNVKKGKHQVGNTVKATCTDNEYIIWACDICGLDDQKQEKANSALGHKYEVKKNTVEVVKATCTTDGYTVIKCSRCDVKNTDNGIAKVENGEDLWVPATGHNYPTEYNKYYKEDYPKCTDDPTTPRDERIGQVYYKCANNCGIDFVTASIRAWDINEKLCHTEAAYRDDTKDHRAATCAITGIEYWFCPDCNKDFAVILPMPEHTKGTPNPGKEPTCLEDGVAPTYFCTVCQQNILDLPEGRTEESYKAPGSHDYKDANCEDPKTCKRCGATEGEALGHTWTPATCTTPKQCSVCRKTEGKANGHSISATVNVKVTCTTDGYDYNYCTVCLKNWKVTNYKYAIEHDFENGTLNAAKSKAPTCTTEGYNVYNCANGCGTLSEKQTVAKLTEDGKHVNVEGQKFGDTCNEGVTNYVCVTPNCGHNAPVHNYKTDANGNRVPYSVGGDCTKYSYVLYMCLDCKAHELIENKEPFAAHNWGAWQTKKPATLTENGYAERKCTRCDVWDTERKTLTADSAVQFDYKITDMKGNQVADKTYAGRIKVTISTTAKDAKGNSLKLDFKFNNKILTFVSCTVSEEALADNFLKYTTSSTVKVANENGCVTILTADMNAKDNYDIISCEFVELVFDINYNSNGEDIAFTADSLILDNEQGEVTSLDSAIEVCKTAALGKLTGTGDVGVADLNKFINIYSTGEYTSAADVDRDGELDIDDYVALQNYILGDKSSIK